MGDAHIERAACKTVPLTRKHRWLGGASYHLAYAGRLFHLTTQTTKKRVYSSGLVGIGLVAIAGASRHLATAPEPSYFPFMIFASMLAVLL